MADEEFNITDYLANVRFPIYRKLTAEVPSTVRPLESPLSRLPHHTDLERSIKFIFENIVGESESDFTKAALKHAKEWLESQTSVSPRLNGDKVAKIEDDTGRYNYTPEDWAAYGEQYMRVLSEYRALHRPPLHLQALQGMTEPQMGEVSANFDKFTRHIEEEQMEAERRPTR